MSATHTQERWSVDVSRAAKRATRCRVIADDGTLVATVELASANTDMAHDVASLIADAPAMKLALALICAGVARIEVSPSGHFTEFCFDGLRYMLSDDGKLTQIITAIGWNRAVAALEAARGAM